MPDVCICVGNIFDRLKSKETIKLRQRNDGIVRIGVRNDLNVLDYVRSKLQVLVGGVNARVVDDD